MEQKTIWPGWEIVRTIGSGGFGKVYEIRKTGEETGEYRSALKVISIPQSADEYRSYVDDGYDEKSITAIFKSQIDDIVTEFQTMAQFRGTSHIVSYEDHMIVHKEDEPGWDILIRMELLTSLPEYFGKKGGLGEQEIIKLGIDVCTALELCAKYHLIHRDIKPQNIFINAFGDFKLGDFGIAKTMDHTTKATKIGTYSYMAPEVYQGKPYNATVDVYSLGLVLYWLLNERRLPFIPLPPEVPTAAQSNEALAKRLSGESLPEPKHGSAVLKKTVLKACAFQPEERYASAKDFCEALNACLSAAKAAPILEQKVQTESRCEYVDAQPDDEETDGIWQEQTDCKDRHAGSDEQTVYMWEGAAGNSDRTQKDKEYIQKQKALKDEACIEKDVVLSKKKHALVVLAVLALFIFTIGYVRGLENPKNEEVTGKDDPVINSTDSIDDSYTQDSRSIRAQIERAGALSAESDYVGGLFAWPLPNRNTTIRQPYGLRTNHITGRSELHTGIDVEAEKSTKVYAANDGIVVHTGTNQSYGNYAIVSHGGGYTTLYARLDSLCVAVEEAVKQGDEIGEVGNTVSDNSYYLHFETCKNGAAYSPMSELTVPGEKCVSGHEWITATCDTPSICSICGETEGKALGHSWMAATCTTAKMCSVCGETQGSVKGHSWIPADYINPQTCKVCGLMYGHPLKAKVKLVDAEDSRTCIIRSNGKVESIGRTYGAYDISAWDHIVDIGASSDIIVGLREDGTLVASGSSEFIAEEDVEELKDITAISVNVLWVVGLTNNQAVVAKGYDLDFISDIENWENIVDIDCGREFVVGLRANGTVVADGNLMNGENAALQWTDIKAIRAGEWSIVGLKENGTVVVASNDGYDVSSWSGIMEVCAGNKHVVGLKSDGTVVATGDNTFGQCNVSAWTDIVSVVADRDYTIGLKADGTLVATGDNTFGQCDVWKLN